MVCVYLKVYPRDPDLVEFHIMTLPSTLIEAPHSEDAKEVTIDTVQHGRAIQGNENWSFFLVNERYFFF